ncbi:MAG: glycosyltransferase family 2 protein [Deltaproteobacteria bacterium]|nr:glycosyltransferase family 2 protein [Deltaproteobacteria bacterium]
MAIENRTLAVVIPAFRAEAAINIVIDSVPSCVDHIIVVDDASPDGLSEKVAGLADPRIILLRHGENLGVGGAMITGFRKALELGADLVAKVDADGQMDPALLPAFAKIAVRHNCDYVKANRFGHMDALPSMPKKRLWGSIALTFLTKFASGCWNVFDPQNGYVLITRRMLSRLNLDALDRGYFFENSMLINLNVMRARIAEIYIPARYGNEISSMKLSSILRTFPGKLVRGFFYRVYQKYVFRSVSPFALLFFLGLLLMAWGGIWGGLAWYESAATGQAAATGTVVLGLLPLLLGFASVLQALVLDVADAGECLLFDCDDESLATGPDEDPCEISP